MCTWRLLAGPALRRLRANFSGIEDASPLGGDLQVFNPVIAMSGEAQSIAF
jgi:hypothetical protein